MIDTTGEWAVVCDESQVRPGRGVAALVDSSPVAVFRLGSSTTDDEWFAVSHIDPVAAAPVMARGLVGSHGPDMSVPTVASPLHKRRYDLRSGECLDGSSPDLEIYEIRVVEGSVQVKRSAS